jgi:glycosyltransferase involved in cell wall biosynthesis
VVEGILLSPDSAASVLVMVPTLNEERGIRRVLQHMPEDLDVLVVNGGSTDEMHACILVKDGKNVSK